MWKVATLLSNPDLAMERSDACPDLAAELVALKPAVIVVGSLSTVLAARNATGTTPIVMTVIVQDPVALGLAVSMVRPGGNVTGFWIEGDETLIGKRLELLKEAVPGTLRVEMVVNSDNPSEAATLKLLPAAARALGLAIRVLEVRATAYFEAAFAMAVREGLQGLHISQDPLFNNYRMEIAAIAAHARLPAVYSFPEFAAAGGVMSYATSLPDAYRPCAALVDKILKGSNPLGLTIPDSLLLRADEVIE